MDKGQEKLKLEIQGLLEHIEVTKQTLKNVNQKESSSIKSEHHLKLSASTSRTTSLDSSIQAETWSQFRTYRKLPGTRNLGREFEEAMCAYYALKLTINEDVDDFEMTSNNVADGRFSDMALRITFTDGSTRKFLFQLKHKEHKLLNIHDLTSNKGLSLRRYRQSIWEMHLQEDTVFILSTNSSTKMGGIERVEEEFYIKQCHQFEFDFLVNTKEGSKNAIFKIKSEGLKEKFYLFTSQNDIKRTEENINMILKRLVEWDIQGSFAKYIRHWWSRNFILTKYDIVGKISELAFSPYLKTLTGHKWNEKTESLRQAIMNFPVTIVQECSEDIVENIWKREESCPDEEFGKTRTKYGLMEHQIKTTFWYLGRIPLIVQVDGLNKTMITRVMNFLWKYMGNKKIVLCGKVSKNDFKFSDTFESLSDVIEKSKKEKYCLYILQNLYVSIQGRESITLENLLSIDDDMAELIGTTELLKMSQEEYLLVGNQEKEMSDTHAPRTISPIFVKTEDIISSYLSSHDILLIVNCNDKFADKFSAKRHIKVMELSQYMCRTYEKTKNVILLSTRGKCTNVQFETICKESKISNVYLLEQCDNGYCILMLRKGRKFEFEFTDTTKAVKENQIFEYYNNPLHVFCAPPGMGKSTLMEVLYNNCSPNCLAVYVSLITHNSFLERLPNFDTIFARFLEIDEPGNDLFKQLKKHLVQKQKVYMFLDGLDEIDSQPIGHILSFVKHVLAQGVNIWLSSRENLREVICQTLNVVPIDIEELDKEEQKGYIVCKLKQSYNDKEIEKITMAVFNSTDLNNSQHLLGIPLHLHLITEMCLHDKQVYHNLEQQNFFVLTKMYRQFFEGKIKFNFKKFGDNKLEQSPRYLRYVLQSYELPALKECLDERDCDRLQIDLNEVKDFLLELKKEGDKYGVIKRINENNEAIFDHQLYAEYFACVWFKKNRNKIGSLRDIIFSKKYENLRLIFDVLLAEDNPLHLAVIYKDIEHFEKHMEDVNYEDKGGRTVFHLAFSYGQKYDPSLAGQCKDFARLKTLPRETSCYMKMIEILLQKGKVPEKKDRLFDLDCVHYALQSGCLYPIEIILGKKLLGFDKLKEPLNSYFDKMSLAYCSAQFGYSNLLSNLIKEDRNLATNEDLLRFAVLGCHNDMGTPPREGNIQAVSILIQMGTISIDGLCNILEAACKEKRFDMLEILLKNEAKCRDGNTILHFLVERCPATYYDELVGAIRKFNIDVNASNILGVTALHLAAESADLKVVAALLANDADLHSRDIDGRTPFNFAFQKSRKHVAKFLLDIEFANAQNQHDVTAVSERSDTEIVKLPNFLCNPKSLSTPVSGNMEISNWSKKPSSSRPIQIAMSTKNEDHVLPVQDFSNNPDVGGQHEINVPALKLNSGQDVEDFSIQSNVSEKNGTCVERRILTTVFDFSTVVNSTNDDNNIIVVKLNTTTERVAKKIQNEGIHLVEISQYINNKAPFKGRFIICTEEHYPDKDIEILRKEECGKSIHAFKAIGEDTFILIRSTSKLNYTSSRTETFPQKEIHSVFDGPLNLLVAEAGMGKSTLMQDLKNKKCFSDFWPIYAHLTYRGSFVNKVHTDEEALEYFMRTEQKELEFLNEFKTRRMKLAIFFDGLDELPKSCVDNLIKTIENLSSTGHHVCLSSRPNLEKRLSETFNIVPLHVLGFSDDDQKTYMKDRLKRHCTKQEIIEIIDRIFHEIKSAENAKFLEVPLHLRILTEIILSEKKLNRPMHRNFCTLPHLYEQVFISKFHHCFEKYQYDTRSSFLPNATQYLQLYEVAALESILDEKSFKDLEIDCRRNRTFLRQFETEKDVLGILSKVDRGKAIFEHETYATYFACVWFKNNQEELKVLNNISPDSYKHLCPMLEIIMTEN